MRQIHCQGLMKDNVFYTFSTVYSLAKECAVSIDRKKTGKFGVCKYECL